MFQSLSTRFPVRFLSIGNVVSVGLQLYRVRLRLYFFIALKACLWLFIPIYGWAKFSAISAMISRLAFSDFIGHSESVKASSSFTNSRMWIFLVTGVLANTLLIIVTVALTIIAFVVWGVVLSLVVGILWIIFQIPPTLDIINNTPPWAVVVLVLAFYVLTLAVISWGYTRFFVTELPLAIEPNINSIKAITRSWKLTKGFAYTLRIQGIIIVGFLIILPIQILLQILGFIPQLILERLIPGDSTLYSNILVFLTFGIFILNAALVIPFWQAIKAVLYYDLRSRREGFGLQLRVREASEENSSLTVHLFNRVTLQTPESVELEFTLAGIGNRAWALLIDYLVLGSLLFVFLVVWSTLSTQLVDFWTQVFGSGHEVWLLAIALIVSFFIYTGYFVFFEAMWQGQTPGKRFANIRVIQDSGRPIGLQQVTLRSLTRSFDDILFLGAFLIIFGHREKRLGDWAAGTIVIQAESPVAAATFAVSDQAQSLAEQLLQTTDFSQLLPDDFAVIRDYLQRRRAMALKARAQVSSQLAQQVQTVIALEQLPAAVTPDVFLETVYLAYQQQSSSGQF